MSKRTRPSWTEMLPTWLDEERDDGSVRAVYSVSDFLAAFGQPANALAQRLAHLVPTPAMAIGEISKTLQSKLSLLSTSKKPLCKSAPEICALYRITDPSVSVSDAWPFLQYRAAFEAGRASTREELENAWWHQLDVASCKSPHQHGSPVRILVIGLPAVNHNRSGVPSGVSESEQKRLPWYHLFLHVVHANEYEGLRNMSDYVILWSPDDAVGSAVLDTLIRNSGDYATDMHVQLTYIGPDAVDPAGTGAKLLRAFAALVRKASGGQEIGDVVSVCPPLIGTQLMQEIGGIDDDPTRPSVLSLAVTTLGDLFDELFQTQSSVLRDRMPNESVRQQGIATLLAGNTAFGSLGNPTAIFTPLCSDIANRRQSDLCRAIITFGNYQKDFAAGSARDDVSSDDVSVNATNTSSSTDEGGAAGDETKAADWETTLLSYLKQRACVVCARPAQFACACGHATAVYCSTDSGCQAIHFHRHGHGKTCTHGADAESTEEEEDT